LESFFKVKTPEEVHRILDRFGPAGTERVPIEAALDRVLCEEITAPEDLPLFPRSSMDGYAVRAKDTFGAAESLPALLEVIGEIPMGGAPSKELGPGQALRISTGGMLPQGADAVVMVEYCRLMDEKTLEVDRPVSPLENVIQPGDDFRKGRRILEKGRRLRFQDLGVLAGLGIGEAPVYTRPRIGIISTGDELVDVHETTAPGQVRDVNRYTLSAFCRKLGAEPVPLGRSGDSFHDLRALIREGLDRTDSVWISGGSSVGTRDLTLGVLESFDGFDLLVHGISISPGKPTIIGRVGACPVLGLPGHVASAMVVAEVFLGRLIRRLSGLRGASLEGRAHLTAVLSRNIESAPGREDYVRVKLSKEGGRWVAVPIFGKSALISTLVEAHGLVRVDLHTEGLYQGDAVRVRLFDDASGGGL